MARGTGLALSSPAWILLLLVVALPLGLAVYTSFTDSSLTSIAPPSFVGLQNYVANVVTGSFVHGLWATVVVILLSLLLQMPIGMLLALALAQPLRGIAIFRGALVVPILMTPVAIGFIWKLLADPDLGLIRLVASWFGVENPNLFASPVGATLLVVVVNSWINIPFVAMMLLAGILGIPEEVTEAAVVDGAGAARRLFSVTLPLVTPVLVTTAAIRVMGDYRMFDLVYIITRGGPGSSTLNLSMLVYQETAQFFNIGAACAMAVAMVIIVLPVFIVASRRSL